MHIFRLALGQINLTVGDLEGNVAKALEYVEKARDLSADLIAFPELTVTGYPPEDLLFKPSIHPSQHGCDEARGRGLRGAGGSGGLCG